MPFLSRIPRLLPLLITIALTLLLASTQKTITLSTKNRGGIYFATGLAVLWWNPPSNASINSIAPTTNQPPGPTTLTLSPPSRGNTPTPTPLNLWFVLPPSSSHLELPLWMLILPAALLAIATSRPTTPPNLQNP